MPFPGDVKEGRLRLPGTRFFGESNAASLRQDNFAILKNTYSDTDIEVYTKQELARASQQKGEADRENFGEIG